MVEKGYIYYIKMRYIKTYNPLGYKKGCMKILHLMLLFNRSEVVIKNHNIDIVTDNFYFFKILTLGKHTFQYLEFSKYIL